MDSVQQDGHELTGRLPSGSVHPRPTRLGADIVERYRALTDLTGTISDACDEFGVVCCVAAIELGPSIPGARMVGIALTLRNVPQRDDAYVNARVHASRAAEIEAHNQAVSGDVLVIEGVRGISNMGGISASIGKRQGELGAIVDGGVRDLPTSRKIDYPIWSKGVSPITAKWRLETLEINRPIVICGVQVKPGDLVAADDTGVCFVPAEHAEAVLARCEEIDAAEERRYADIASGVSVPELSQRTYVYAYSPARHTDQDDATTT